LIDRQTRRE